MYAYITRPSSNETLPKLSPLHIGGKNIRFFIPPFSKSCAFKQHSDNENRWELFFFLDGQEQQSPHTVRLSVRLLADEPQNPIRHLKAKAVHYNNGFDGGLVSQHIDPMSQFLRDSKTLDAKCLESTTTNRYLVNDRDALAYFSADEIQFKRVVLCQALAVAYSEMIEHNVNLLTSAALDKDKYAQLPELYEKVLFFNAAHYFSHPVSRGSHEMFTIWKMIYRHWHIRELNHELTGQLASIAQLLKEHRDKQAHQRQLKEAEHTRQQEKAEENRRQRERFLAQELRETAEAKAEKREKRVNAMMSFFTLLLTALSIASIVELRPEDFQQAYESWHAFFTR